MTPEARIAAACDVLEAVLGGVPGEKALINWARANRYAGSGDRAAVRDLVFDGIRCQRSYAWAGGALSGRGLMIGKLRFEGRDPREVFTGQGYAPPELSADEAEPQPPLDDAPEPVQRDVPDWLWPMLLDGLGDDAPAICEVMRHRAPVFLRVNLAKATREEAAARLAAEAIGTREHALSATALEVTENPRRVHGSSAYRDGLVELQDAASQAVVDALFPAAEGASVLDYCAGGGGKSLALAARGAGRVVAHDADPGRMADLPARAARAGADIQVVENVRGVFDVVLCDAPCSGSGAWRRQPEAKWRLTVERLEALNATQDEILATAAGYVAPGGTLAYATCSLLRAENDDRIAAFLASAPEWEVTERRQLTPLDGGDGFFVATMTRRG